MILVHILLGMDKDQVGLKFPAQLEEVFQDFLPCIGEDAGGKRSQNDLFLGNTQHCHGFIMLVLYILQIGIFLIVRKRDTQHICLLDDVMKQSAAAQFDVVRMRAEKENFFAEEIHNCYLSKTA